jgi:Uma2 family endonuclease
MVAHPILRRFSVAEYENLGRIGFFGPEERVELLDGEIIAMAAIGGDHAGVVRQITRIVVLQTPDGYLVDVQNPLRLDDNSMPQPDLAIIRDRDYGGAVPTAADALLVIEVADSSLDFDRNCKLPRYARAGIPEAWLIDLTTRTITRYSEPRDGRYQQITVAQQGQGLTSIILPPIALAVDQAFR